MRTYDEINAELRDATRANDVHAMRVLATEMQALGTPIAEAAALNALGNVAKSTSDYATALVLFRQALALQEELGSLAGVATVTGNMGNVYRMTGDLSAALEHYRRALDILVDLGDRASVALYTSNVGNVYLTSADYPSALEYYRRALVLNEEFNDRTLEANILGNMGNLYANTTDYPAAFESYSRALAIHEEMGNRSGVAHIAGNMGIWYTSTNDHSVALEWFHRSVAVHTELGNLASVALVSGNIVRALMKLDRYDEAAEQLAEMSTMRMDYPATRADHCVNLAALAEHRGDLDAARHQLLDALKINTEAGLRAQAASCHERLRDLAQKRNDFAGFIEHNAEFLRITEEVRGKDAMQRMAMMEAERKVEGERREREKERALLHSALPKSVADRMIRGEKVTGDHYAEATVIFADIVGFTAMSDRLPPAEVVLLLEKIFSSFDAVCEHHNVTKIKTIGDSYMAVAFPSETSQQHHVIRAAQCALELLRTTSREASHEVSRETSRVLTSREAPLDASHEVSREASRVLTSHEVSCEAPLDASHEVTFRIGMHCGPVTAGVIGTQRLQYDVWGDTVNVASRMESAGLPGRVHITEAVVRAIENQAIENREYRMEERGEIEVKGKGMMRTYWLEPTP